MLVMIDDPENISFIRNLGMTNNFNTGVKYRMRELKRECRTHAITNLSHLSFDCLENHIAPYNFARVFFVYNRIIYLFRFY